MPTRIVNLASGSRGNATCVLRGGRGVLVDCGLSRRETLRRLAEARIDPRGIEALLLTHEHTDHVRGAARLSASLGVPVMMTAGTARHSGLAQLPAARLVAPLRPFALAGMRITAIPTSHDAAEPCAFRLDGPDLSLLLLTDLGTVDGLPTASLSGLDVLYVEANHDPVLLRDGPYPAFLKHRIAGPRGHLSNRQCGELVATARRHSSRLRIVVLGHLSEQNNEPELALADVREAAGDPAGVRWLVARQDTPTVILEESTVSGRAMCD